ncbi:hypothetical protein Clow_01342 [Corynebacterium lowii]|uniref:Peptidase family S51 n=1 Tax=Corynebacterium lowii TaxID=1544413 RepID=A0A0Q0UJM2_9CORY|nr:hypothetical protein Clow_01342 [Corynebacterium lowii]MDP9850907.1 peptidase E [Corynebacterium lowii]
MSYNQDIVLLGGGFSDSSDDGMDEYLISGSGVKNPNVCFIPTASGDSPTYIRRFYESMEGFRCRPHYVELFVL